MRGDNYKELNNIFWNSLNREKIEMLTDCFEKNEGLLYSSKHRSLIQKVFENRKINNVLAPTFGFGATISWMENKRIVAFEENASIYKLAKLLWVDKDINLINNDFLGEEIIDKYEAIVFTSPCGWVKTATERSIRLEKEYINKALNCLDKDGLMVITVPSNVLTYPLWQGTRQRIIDDFSLEMIIHDGQVFPETRVDWYTIIISNSIQRETVYYAELDDNIDEIMLNYLSNKGDFWVEIKELHSRWDIEYMSPKYALIRREIYNKNTTKLGEMAEIIRGISFSPEERLESGDYMILTPRLIDENMIVDNPMCQNGCRAPLKKVQ